MLDKNGNFVPNKRREAKIDRALDRLDVARDSKLADLLRPGLRGYDMKGQLSYIEECFCNCPTVRRYKSDPEWTSAIAPPRKD